MISIIGGIIMTIGLIAEVSLVATMPFGIMRAIDALGYAVIAYAGIVVGWFFVWVDALLAKPEGSA